MSQRHPLLLIHITQRKKYIMRTTQIVGIIAAVAFAVSKLVLYFDPMLADVASDGAASFGFSIGFIIGSLVFLAPFVVAHIREHVNKWWILALLLGVPFVAGFFVGLVGAGPAGMSFVNAVITPLAWVAALIWSLMNANGQKLSNSDFY